jgi:alkylated DNA repair dioxygenase AlkB
LKSNKLQLYYERLSGEFSGNFNWHTDNHRHGEKIFAIALCDARVIGFRAKKRTKSIYRLPLNQGDAYLMKGTARWHWEHRVMPVGMQGSGGRSFIMSYKG